MNIHSTHMAEVGLLHSLGSSGAMLKLQLYDKWLLRAKPHTVSADLQPFGLSATGSVLISFYLSLTNTLTFYSYFPLATHINFDMSIKYFCIECL